MKCPACGAGNLVTMLDFNKQANIAFVDPGYIASVRTKLPGTVA